LQGIIGDSLSSMIDHDKLVDWEGRKATRYDKERTQFEATGLASKMAEKLKQSREQIRGTPLNAPTWTGKRGVAGAPQHDQKKRRFGTVTNSKTTLPIASGTGAGVLQKERLLSSQVIMNNNSEASLISDLQSFLLSCGKKATTEVIVKHFKNKIKPNESYLFKQMLRQIAVLDKIEGVWELKEEYY